jgi:hypothetical protein
MEQNGIDDEQYRTGARTVGPETEMQERLERAKRGLPLNDEPQTVKRVRDHSGNLCWPPFHDPRKESRWLKESGREEPEDAPPPVVIEHLDQHVKDHRKEMSRIAAISNEFKEVMQRAWMHRTGQQKSIIAVEAGTGSDGGLLYVRVDHNEAAAKYLESTLGWSELLWPVVVAIGDGKMRKDDWGNMTPSFPLARRLWVRFAPLLMRRLERQPFAAHIEELEELALRGMTKRAA